VKKIPPKWKDIYDLASYQMSSEDAQIVISNLRKEAKQKKKNYAKNLMVLLSNI
jgi:hypothetical protein